MNTNDKELYESPSMLVFEVRQEGVICTSYPLGAGGFPECRSPSEAWGLQFDFLTSYARETKVPVTAGAQSVPSSQTKE